VVAQLGVHPLFVERIDKSHDISSPGRSTAH
jgi:hypothetical protein